MGKPLTVEAIKQRIPNRVSIDETTYVHSHKKCRFVDNVYGEFWNTPQQVIRGVPHPKHSQEKRRQTNLLKYGYDNPSKSPEIKKKFIDKIKQKIGLTEEVINSRLPQTIKVDFSTYKGVNILARFVHEKYGEFWQRPNSAMRLGRHPKERILLFQKAITPASEVANKLPTGIRMDESTYWGTHHRALFYQEGIEEGWWTTPNNIMRQQSRHPALKYKKAGETNLLRYGKTSFLATKQCRDVLAQKNKTSSTGEREVKDFLASIGVVCFKKYITYNGIHYEIDMLSKDENIGIEYNGEFWHSERRVGKKLHHIKMLALRKLGIKLIQIFEYEWKTRRRQVESFLRTIFNKNSITINVDQCQVKEISSSTALDFLNTYNVKEATVPPHFSVGAYNGEELVFVASLGKRSNKIFLIDYCNKEGITVTNIISKVSRFTSEALKEDIVLNVDNRWDDGKGFLEQGWSFVKKLCPGFFYYNIKKHKLSTKKPRVKDDLVKIWDAGKRQFIYKFTHPSILSL